MAPRPLPSGRVGSSERNVGSPTLSPQPHRAVMNPATPEPLPDDELVRLGRGGDESALVELYHRYRPRVMAFATRMTGDPDLAEEVFCNTFTAFFASIG